MSVIGTTHKQPRVFSHDALAISDLPGCIYNQVSGIAINTAPGTNYGKGFELNGVYIAILDEYEGRTVMVKVTAIDPATGSILSVGLTDIGCPQNTNLRENDLLSVIWTKTDGGTFSEGSSAIDAVKITSLDNSNWDYGCPISPIETRFKGPVNKGYNPLKSYRKKDTVKYIAPFTNPITSGEPQECEFLSYSTGASLYVGYDLSRLEVVMESGKPVTWYNVPAGSFMPVSVLTVIDAEAAGPNDNDKPTKEDLKEYILALF